MTNDGVFLIPTFRLSFRFLDDLGHLPQPFHHNGDRGESALSSLRSSCWNALPASLPASMHRMLILSPMFLLLSEPPEPIQHLRHAEWNRQALTAHRHLIPKPSMETRHHRGREHMGQQRCHRDIREA